MSGFTGTLGRIHRRASRALAVASGVGRMAANARPVRAHSVYVPLSLADRLYVAGTLVVILGCALTWVVE
jgi:hypothetical protein